MQKIISMWSGPRNVSTALMYAFAQRSDTKVIDEPFYACYLKNSGAKHPGGQLVMANLPADENRVIREVIMKEKDRPVLFLKNMAHHLFSLKTDFLSGYDNVFLIRNPEQVLPSLMKVYPDPTMRDVAYKKQYELFMELCDQDKKPAIIDSDDLVNNPESILNSLCRHLKLPFELQMLSWPMGGIKEDGVWAPFWYENVHKSTGFMPFKEKNGDIPEAFRPLLEDCKFYYNELKTFTLNPTRNEH